MKVFSGSLNGRYPHLEELFSDGTTARPQVEVVVVAPSKADKQELGTAAGLGPGFCSTWLKLRTGMLPSPEREVFEAGILDRDTARVVLIAGAGEGPVLDITGGQEPVEIGHFVLQGRGLERVAVYGPRE